MRKQLFKKTLSNFGFFVFLLPNLDNLRSHVTLLASGEGASVQNLKFLKELTVLASTRVFRKKTKLIFDFCLYLTLFCKRKTYSE